MRQVDSATSRRRRRTSASRLGTRRRRSARSPSQGPSSVHLCPRLLDACGSRAAGRAPRRSRRARGCRSVQTISSTCVERPQPALPVDEACPMRSAIGATGRTTSARSVTADARTSRLTRKLDRVEGCERGGRVGQVVDVDAADHQRLEVARAPRRPGSRRCRDPAWTTRDRGPMRQPGRRALRRRASGRPPGSRLGSRPVSSAPRSPARRGIQAELARRSTRPASATALSAPGDGASPLADQDHAATVEGDVGVDRPAPAIGRRLGARAWP